MPLHKRAVVNLASFNQQQGPQSSSSVKIEGKEEATKKLPVRASTSTQPEKQASGGVVVHSSSRSVPPKPPGRTTRTAQRAAQPYIPSDKPPTHPVQCVPSSPAVPIPGAQSCDGEPAPEPPFLNLPTISQLRDFPNLSTPILQHIRPVIVTLPNSAPSSPIPIPNSYLDIESGDPFTPEVSPNQVSVILHNPNFSRVPPLPPRSSTPTTGSWDNYLDDPTYHIEQEFWRSRGSDRRIQIVSTDISDIEDTSFMSSLQPPQLSLLDQGLLEASSMALSAAEEALKEMEEDVRDKCSDMNPALIIVDTAAATKEELQEISEARNLYRKGVRKLLKDFASELTSPQKLQWESDLESVVNLVNQHKRDVVAKVNQLVPPSSSHECL